MTFRVARTVMYLAVRALPRDQRVWGDAMEAEFAEAAEVGRPLSFALGCLAATWRGLPLHTEGRLTLARHMLALGAIVPIATINLLCAYAGLVFLLTGGDHYYAQLAAGGAADRSLAEAYRSAAPALTALILTVALAHLATAWTILDRRWRRAAALWLLCLPCVAALVWIISSIDPSPSGIALQLAALLVELLAIPPLAAWHARGTRIDRVDGGTIR